MSKQRANEEGFEEGVAMGIRQGREIRRKLKAKLTRQEAVVESVKELVAEHLRPMGKDETGVIKRLSIRNIMARLAYQVDELADAGEVS